MTIGAETRPTGGLGIETGIRTGAETVDAKKILIVSYHFPPDGQVGAVRPAKFAKYLRPLGWTPYVLTIGEAYLSGMDAERLRELTGIRIERTPVWPTLSSLLLKLRDGVKRALGLVLTEVGASTVRGQATGAPAEERRPGGLAWHLRRYLDSCFELPDKRVGWLLPAVWRGYRLVKREGIDTILTSSPPATTALVGLAIAVLTRTRVFTDLRDPWYSPIGRSPESSSVLSDAIMRGLERILVTYSKAVIVTTDQYAQFLRDHHRVTPPDKVCTIWNGFDPEDVEAVADIEPSPTFTISYLGTFYLGRTPEPFLKALGGLVREGRVRRDEVRVRFIGHVQEVDGHPVGQMVEAQGLSGCVEITPPVPYREALRVMKASDVLLLLAPAQYYCIPAKAFEYLAMRRRILCVSPDGATADLIRRTRAGLVIEPDDVQGIRAAFLRFFEESTSGLSDIGDDCKAFERGRLVKELADLLDRT